MTPKDPSDRPRETQPSVPRDVERESGEPAPAPPLEREHETQSGALEEDDQRRRRERR
jgi:hypothetical protein